MSHPLIALRFLHSSGFSIKQSVAGVLGALWHYPPALHAEHDGKQLHHALTLVGFHFNSSG